MANCRVTNKNTTCVSASSSGSASNSTANACESFDTCLPLGARLTYNGECLTYTPSSTPLPDGVYTNANVTLENNCIVNITSGTAPQYQPSPCTPAVTPCDGDTGGVVLDPAACNILTTDASGRLRGCLNILVDPSSPVNISGQGTADDPLTITWTGTIGDRTYIVSGTSDVLPISGTGTLANPYIISHSESILPGTGPYNGVTYDEYGHAVGYTAPEINGIIGVEGADGITVDVEAGIATVSLTPIEATPGTYLMGGYNVTVDLAGRTIDVVPAISLTPGTYDPLFTIFDVNGLGSIESITPVLRQADINWSKIFTGNREDNTIIITPSYQGELRIHYTGTLVGTTTTTDGLAPLPAPYEMQVNGVGVSAFALVAGGVIIGVESFVPNTYAPGSHSISLITTDDPATTFTGLGILDVFLVSAGE